MAERAPECETFRYSLFQCRRGQVDARTRIQVGFFRYLRKLSEGIVWRWVSNTCRSPLPLPTGQQGLLMQAATAMSSEQQAESGMWL
jgi:hypothetical protein